MTKTVHDLAGLLDVFSNRKEDQSFTSYITSSWSEIGVATWDPEVWIFPATFLKPVKEATEQWVSLLCDITSVSLTQATECRIS